ncbi:class E sortase [Pseudofrankia inefficax]|nr:class E sortase [Pseudofrankia inefficax]
MAPAAAADPPVTPDLLAVSDPPAVLDLPAVSDLPASPEPQPVPLGQGGRRRRARIGGAVVRGAGELLITLGLVVALFLAYELWITDIFQARTQSRLHNKLAATWAAPARPAAPAPPPPAAPLHPAVGEGFAELHIPRLGAGYAPVIVEGVGEAQLQEGPGHYPGTAMPGEIGNFVVSGHRTTYGKPFNELDELRPGDPVVVEVSDRYYVYRMTRAEVVAPTRLDVTYPVPEQAGKVPTAAVMTMTTCNPKYSAKTRLIVFAKLDKTVMKAPGVGVPFEPVEG